MANVTISPNMGLPVPSVGVDPGPDWANNINAALSILDGHTHVSGSGVQITPSGLNINSDLTFNSNNIYNLRSVRLFPQGSPISGATDLGCLYESGVDLYYNDGNGTQVRITQSGGIAGSPGSIANLTSPASATYVSANQTFVWQSAASTPANLDAGSVIFRNVSANSNGITVEAPSSLASNYSITLPALPGVTSVLTIDAAGNMGTQTYDQVGQNMTVVGVDAIATTMDASGANTIYNTRTMPVAFASTAVVGGFALNGSSGNFQTNSTSYVSVTNMIVTVPPSVTGRPIKIGFMPTVGTALAHMGTGIPPGLNVTRSHFLINGGAGARVWEFAVDALTGPESFGVIDYNPDPGPNTYILFAKVPSGTNVAEVVNVDMYAYGL